MLAARRAARRADGADPQGQGGARGRQRLRGRPVRADRQPRQCEGVRRLRRAVPGRHRLPLPRLPADREEGDPARRARCAHRPADAGRPRRSSATPASVCRRCSRSSSRRPTGTTSTRRGRATGTGRSGSSSSLDPAYDRKPKGLLRRKVDNPDARVRPELLAAAVDRHAASDAVFTTDTGMATVWLSRFVRMSGTRRLIGSYNLGSMANAMPMALGASALDRQRQVVAFCGDGGHLDAARRPDHGRLPRPPGQAGRLRQRPARDGQAGDGAGRPARVRHRAAQPRLRQGGRGHRHARHAGRATRRRGRRGQGGARARRARCCSTCSPTPTRSRSRRRPTLEQGWGFAIAKTKEFVDSAE